MTNKTVVVVTPTVASEHLSRCIESVQAQTYSRVEHLIIADGAEYGGQVTRLVKKNRPSKYPVHVQVLPYNTGQGRHHGYRICAAFAYLVNADVVFFLDDDNTYDAQHIETCMDAMFTFDVGWAFALRRICDASEQFLIDDDCDSLGFWRRADSYSGDAEWLAQEFQDFYSIFPFLVDTNCYAIKRDVLVQAAPMLIQHRKGDAFFASHLVRTHSGACTGRRTVNYRVRKQNEETLKSYFGRGNATMLTKYKGIFPWLTPQRCGAYDMDRLRRSFV